MKTSKTRSAGKSKAKSKTPKKKMKAMAKPKAKALRSSAKPAASRKRAGSRPASIQPAAVGDVQVRPHASVEKTEQVLAGVGGQTEVDAFDDEADLALEQAHEQSLRDRQATALKATRVRRS